MRGREVLSQGAPLPGSRQPGSLGLYSLGRGRNRSSTHPPLGPSSAITKELFRGLSASSGPLGEWLCLAPSPHFPCSQQGAAQGVSNWRQEPTCPLSKGPRWKARERWAWGTMGKHLPLPTGIRSPLSLPDSCLGWGNAPLWEAVLPGPALFFQQGGVSGFIHTLSAGPR